MSSQSASYTFSKWYMYGSGWSTSYQASCTVTVTRNYGSDIATITVSNAKMYTYGGDTSRWRFYLKIGNGSWQYWDLSNGWHGAETWYNYGSHSWTTSVGAGSGNLNLTICFNAYDTNNNISADSGYKYPSLWYDTKGASTISSATNVTLSKTESVATTVKFVSYSSSFTHRLRAYCNGSWSSYSDYIQGQNSQTITAGLALPSSFIDAITTSNSGSCTIYLYTYSNGTEIGSSTQAITLTLPSGIEPTVTVNSITKSAVVTNSLTNKCTLIDAVAVSWNYTPYKVVSTSAGSPIDKGTVKIGTTVSGSDTSGSYTSGALSVYGNLLVTVEATDQRGNTAGAGNTVEIYRYFYPAFSSVKFNTDNSLDIIGSIAYVNGENTPSLTLKIYKGQATTGATVDLTGYIPAATGTNKYDKAYQINFNYPIPSSYIPDIATETYRFEVIIGDSVDDATMIIYSAVAVMTFGAGGTDIRLHKPITEMSAEELDSTANLNTYTAGFREFLCTSVQNKPSGTGTTGRCIVYPNMQMYIDYGTSGAIPAVYFRLYDTQWRSWRKITATSV